MAIVKINTEQWSNGVKSAGKVYNIIGPVKKGQSYNFQKLDKSELPNLQLSNTLLSPKEFLFPQSEKILKYSMHNSISNSNMEVVEKNYFETAIIGIRPCDAKANTLLKMNFDTSEVKDPYWVNAYEATTFIGLACNNPCNSCFCTTANSGPFDTKGLDIILVPIENDQYILKVITKKGEKFFNTTNWKTLSQEKPSLFDKYKNISEAKIPAEVITDKLKELNTIKLHAAPFWDDVSFACVNCGICTFICPTCWCFDIQDEICGTSLGVRIKNWDSCMFPIFTAHTTGHNPRGKKKDRVRQRFMHKLKYFVDKYDGNIMCVGCGRCVRSCPVSIDIRKICKLMNKFDSKTECAA